MTRIVVDKSTDNGKSHAICFLPQYQLNKKMSFSEPKLKEALRYKLKRCLLFYRQGQISQSDCEISSNCGKNESSKPLSSAEVREVRYRNPPCKMSAGAKSNWSIWTCAHIVQRILPTGKKTFKRLRRREFQNYINRRLNLLEEEVHFCFNLVNCTIFVAAWVLRMQTPWFLLIKVSRAVASEEI